MFVLDSLQPFLGQHLSFLGLHPTELPSFPDWLLGHPFFIVSFYLGLLDIHTADGNTSNDTNFLLLSIISSSIVVISSGLLFQPADLPLFALFPVLRYNDPISTVQLFTQDHPFHSNYPNSDASCHVSVTRDGYKIHDWIYTTR